MPELPEVESLARFVTEQAGGQQVVRTELASFAALKTFDPPLEALRGEVLADAGRRGKFLTLRFRHDLWLVLHLARGGWLRWRDELSTTRAKPSPKSPLALRLGFAGGGGFEVTEAGTEKRLALYVVRSPADVEGLARLGPDPFEIDLEELSSRLAAAGASPLKAVLADQAVLAGVGNAYSDEVLHTAQLSPFKPASKLSDEEVGRLHRTLRTVLEDALQRSLGLPAAGLKAEKKEGLRVHGRAGQACPVCGDTVREVSYATKAFQYCPTCQTGGKVLADRRLSRLLR
ncbi:MAG: Formamidopyrimidine-DNA glycosylase [uncultured Acidimicrobiales bacterium]|uniref:Formamidopyrimidine-DNA glycosylase n=1 Tax=uncultured Acidimicrobiales bacterium TaxID=310071 RepID=A0A6J4HSB7_9ACTN|nr:MAG: Formamidopyrimidine-DNA glycosylase [uncultured Acidimicrobiales bacterium]